MTWQRIVRVLYVLLRIVVPPLAVLHLLVEAYCLPLWRGLAGFGLRRQHVGQILILGAVAALCWLTLPQARALVWGGTLLLAGLIVAQRALGGLAAGGAGLSRPERTRYLIVSPGSRFAVDGQWTVYDRTAPRRSQERVLGTCATRDGAVALLRAQAAQQQAALADVDRLLTHTQRT